MKITFINAYQNIVNRGAETYVIELSKRLKKNHKVVIISGSRKPLPRWQVLWRFFLDPSGIYVFWFTFKNLSKIWREKSDVVIPVNGGWQPALVRIITWLYGGKMIISGQSGIGWDDRNNLWCFPDFFVALSSFAKNWARKANPFIKVKYIPNGVDLTKFRPEDLPAQAGEKFKTNLKKPIVLCVGALEPQKRIDLVIKAVSKHKNASLLVVGDGGLREDIRVLGEKMLGERFQLIKADFEDMPKIYRAADIFTIPSESYQSFEIVLVESMATNVPVVANDDPIRAEIVGNAGRLVDPTDLDSYASALEKVLRISWSSKPRNQAEKFSWDKIVSLYEQLFKKKF